MPGPEIALLLGRTGAARFADLRPEVQAALDAGLLETANLVEFLAIDLNRLAPAVARHLGLDPQADRLLDTLAMLPDIKPMKRHSHIARALYDLAAAHPQPDAVAQALATHPSDVARCWATHWVLISGLGLAAKLASVRRFAVDPHFGVREMAWMALRDDVAADLDAALPLLVPWVQDTDASLRRFASELTRPRGVWCAQIERLKAEPWHGLPLIEPLKADPSRYVQNSVANWLNDAAKTQPQWVEQTCARWSRESPGKATAHIVRRACRSLTKE